MDHRIAHCVNHRTAYGVMYRRRAAWRFFLIGLGIVVLPEVGTGLGREEAAAQAPARTEERTGQNRPASTSAPVRETPAAAATRLRLARVKVRGSFQDARLGDILKEFAQLAEEQTGEPVLWTYAPGFPAQVRIQVELAEQSLLQALDQVLTAGSKASQQNLGYVVLSLPDHKHDGWVRLTTHGERGQELPAATAEEEQQAHERLATAQKLLADNKPAAAKIYLEVIVKKYPTTAAARQARLLLEKIGP
jgi:hypothetical protein